MDKQIIKDLNLLNIDAIRKTKEKLKNEVIHTPVIHFNSSCIKKLFPQTDIFMKLELFQFTGTFKARGALSVCYEIEENKKKYGITAASAGNHAIAASWAAKKLGLSAKVVMRSTANPYRVAQAKLEGAEILITDKIEELFETAKQLVDEELRTFIHPFEGINTTLGTAGIGMEFIESIPNLDAVIVSIGGGGLISGVASAVKMMNSKCRVFGVEPEGANSMYTSFIEGKPIQNANTNTIVDSLAPPMTLPFSYAVCKNYIDEIVTVSDDEICASMLMLQQEAKLAVEPAAAATLAALARPLNKKLKNKKVGLLMCGANIDALSYSSLLERGEQFIKSDKWIYKF